MMKIMIALSLVTLWIADNWLPLAIVMVVLGVNFLRDAASARREAEAEQKARLAAMPTEQIVVMDQQGRIVFSADPTTGGYLTHDAATRIAEAAGQGWIVTTRESVERQEAANALVNSRADQDTVVA